MQKELKVGDILTFTNSQITQISHLFGDKVMTGSEITRVLARTGIDDAYGDKCTKWRRLEHAFTVRQNNDGAGNAILRFISEVLSPVNYVKNQQEFEDIRNELNPILSFSGIYYRQDGKFGKGVASKTISDARRRVESIVPKLRERGVHYRVLQYCNEELLQENYFHAVFEAAKSLPDYVRTLTNLKEDGAPLFDKAFSTTSPYLILNDLKTESQRNQQKGLCMLLKGIYSMVRNVTAHEPKIKWIVDEVEAIDILMTISFLHKNLDSCQVIKMD